MFCFYKGFLIGKIELKRNVKCFDKSDPSEQSHRKRNHAGCDPSAH